MIGQISRAVEYPLPSTEVVETVVLSSEHLNPDVDIEHFGTNFYNTNISWKQHVCLSNNRMKKIPLTLSHFLMLRLNIQSWVGRKRVCKLSATVSFHHLYEHWGLFFCKEHYAL